MWASKQRQQLQTRGRKIGGLDDVDFYVKRGNSKQGGGRLCLIAKVTKVGILKIGLIASCEVSGFRPIARGSFTGLLSQGANGVNKDFRHQTQPSIYQGGKDGACLAA